MTQLTLNDRKRFCDMVDKIVEHPNGTPADWTAELGIDRRTWDRWAKRVNEWADPNESGSAKLIEPNTGDISTQGRQLYNLWRESFNLKAQERAILQRPESNSKTIRVAMCQTVVYFLLPQIARTFRDSCPGYTISPRMLDRNTLIRELKSDHTDSLDVVLDWVGYQKVGADVTQVRLPESQTNVSILLNAWHELASKPLPKSFTSQNLEGYPIVCPNIPKLRKLVELRLPNNPIVDALHVPLVAKMIEVDEKAVGVIPSYSWLANKVANSSVLKPVLWKEKETELEMIGLFVPKSQSTSGLDNVSGNDEATQKHNEAVREHDEMVQRFLGVVKETFENLDQARAWKEVDRLRDGILNKSDLTPPSTWFLYYISLGDAGEPSRPQWNVGVFRSRKKSPSKTLDELNFEGDLSLRCNPRVEMDAKLALYSKTYVGLNCWEKVAADGEVQRRGRGFFSERVTHEQFRKQPNAICLAGTFSFRTYAYPKQSSASPALLTNVELDPASIEQFEYSDRVLLLGQGKTHALRSWRNSSADEGS